MNIIMLMMGMVVWALSPILPALAQSSPTVVISEIFWSGSEFSQADEWLELQNTSSSSIDLTGWQILGAASGGGSLTLPEGTTLGGNESLLISNYAPKSGKTMLSVQADVVDNSISLSNSKLELILVNQTGQEVDRVGDGGKPFAGGKDPETDIFASMERVSLNESGTLADNWARASSAQNSIGTSLGSPTPSSGSIVVLPEPDTSPSSTSVPGGTAWEDSALPEEPAPDGSEQSTGPDSQTLVLNELYPSTAGKDAEEEFIELKNTSTVSVNLAGWSITDASDKTFTFQEGTVPGLGLFLLTRQDSKLTLNNSNESLELRNPNNSIVDQVSYETSTKGATLARINSVWEWTGDPTPNEPNRLSQIATSDSSPSVSESKDEEEATVLSTKSSSPDGTVSIAAAQALPDGTTVSLEGTATVEPGVLGKQFFYIQDDTSGIQIYKYDAAFPAFQIGDLIAVTGELSTTSGERRLKIPKTGSISVLKQNAQAPPAPVNTTMLKGDDVGTLVQVSGLVESRSATKVTLENEDGSQSQVRLSKNTGIDGEVFERGAAYTVTGITRLSSGSPVVSPRSMEDISDSLMVLASSEHQEDVAVGNTDATSQTGKEMQTQKQQTAANVLLTLTLLVLIGLLARYVLKRYGTYFYQHRTSKEVC